MNTNNAIIKFLSQIPKEEARNYLRNDNLIYLLKDEVKDKSDFNDVVKYNMKVLFTGIEGTLFKVVEIFRKNEISYIVFKGIVLAHALYNEPYRRALGDIDIFVDSVQYNKALKLLMEIGYKIKYEKGMEDQHHIVLTNDKVIVELHRRIYNSEVNVKEEFLKNNLTFCMIKNYKIISFNKTATILHLLYHLYMDSYLEAEKVYQVLVHKKVPQAGRFLYRAYEIALFSEKYYKEINWDDIKNDLEHQKLCIIFKKMIMDILEIFPETFPQSFIDTVRQLNYSEEERWQVINCMLESNCMMKENNIEDALCKYIDSDWNKRKEYNICKKIGETFEITNKGVNEELRKDLRCGVKMELLSCGIEFAFSVSDDDFYFSEVDEYDTLRSDGVHLLIYGTEKYSYNSIFLFPKLINAEFKVVAYDLEKKEVLSDALIKTSFVKTQKGYTITATLCDEFIMNNYLENYFYLGLVISDCDSQTGSRVNQIISSGIDFEWNNPAFFAKMLISH